MSEYRLTAYEALERLKKGNAAYMDARTNSGDISPEIREKTSREGQRPYAVIITCSDSRVIPESIFSAGIGELFVIRVAGNIIGRHQLGSVEYAVSHLGCPLTVVLGHTRCGAVGAALSGGSEGYIKFITDEIKRAVGDEKDDYKACRANVERGVGIIADELNIGRSAQASPGVVGAVYRVETGEVEFL